MNENYNFHAGLVIKGTLPLILGSWWADPLPDPLFIGCSRYAPKLSLCWLMDLFFRFETFLIELDLYWKEGCCIFLWALRFFHGSGLTPIISLMVGIPSELSSSDTLMVLFLNVWEPVVSIWLMLVFFVGTFWGFLESYSFDLFSSSYSGFSSH